MPTIKTYALRLMPGNDLKLSLKSFVDANRLTAAWIVTCVGSITQYNIRYANQPGGTSGSGYYEIVSLGGTLSVNGSHIHISISDPEGNTLGGHLLEGCIVFTTAEIIIQSSEKLHFWREKDGTTGWEELMIDEIP